MKMATDNLKGEQQRRLEARKNYIEQRLKPLDSLQSLSDGKISFRFAKQSIEIC
jgi:proline dehydrogenase